MKRIERGVQETGKQPSPASKITSKSWTLGTRKIRTFLCRRTLFLSSSRTRTRKPPRLRRGDRGHGGGQVVNGKSAVDLLSVVVRSRWSGYWGLLVYVGDVFGGVYYGIGS